MFIKNKYTRWYYSIVNKSTNITIGYTETHHIIPRSLGGSNCKNNLVKLSAREHFICHLLLTKMVTGQLKYKMIFALNKMLRFNEKQQRHIPGSSRIYQYIREHISKHMSVISKQRWQNEEYRTKTVQAIREAAQNPETIELKRHVGEDNGMYGKTHTDQVKQKLAQCAKERFADKSYEQLYGEEKAAELRHIRSTKMKQHKKENPAIGIKNPNAKRFLVTDPHGNQYIVDGNMKQFCQQHGLSRTSMSSLATGQLKSYRKWTIIKIDSIHNLNHSS